MTVDKTIALDLYRTMVKIRTFEECLGKAYYEGKLPAFDIAAGPIPGELHLSSGQEAPPAGVCAHLRPDDMITGSHRGHGPLLAKGVDMKIMMAEIFGKKTGLCQGKGGHMHLFNSELHFGVGGIVAGGIPQAVGGALAFKKRGEDRVAATFFGDGAANAGPFHESLNLAAVWNVPVIFIIEDNEYAISVPKADVTARNNNIDRAAAYGIPAARIDGKDVIAVYEAAKEAVARARRGDGPSLLEIATFRFRGHFEGDAEGYLKPGEKENWKKNDPIPFLAGQMKANGWVSDNELKAIDEEISKQVAEAENFARTSAYPAPEEALLHVFAQA